MKIGIVISQTPTYSETFFNSKIRGLQDSGFEVILFTQSNNSSFGLCRVVRAPKVHRNLIRQFCSIIAVGIRLLPHLRKVVKFLKLEKGSGRDFQRLIKNIYSNAHLLCSHKLDWLHFGFATMGLNSENVARAIGAKMSVSLRGFDVAIYPLKHERCYELLWDRVDKVHSISNDLLKKAHILGLPEDKPTNIIPPAIDVDFFKEITQEKDQNNDAINFLTVARLHWKKGITDMIQSLALLKEEGVKFTYSIIGEGQELEALKFQVYQQELEQNVFFLGKKEPIEVVELMKNAQIYLQYSISEGFCNAVLEAQAIGCLCIVSDAEGLPENVLDGETGWVVPKNNPKALVGKILEISQLPKDAKAKIRKAAQKRVSHEFNLESQRKQFEAFYTN